jgi:HSP20 family protein
MFTTRHVTKRSTNLPSELSAFHSLFGEFFDTSSHDPAKIGVVDLGFPKTDIIENDTAFIVELGLSGWKRDELKVELLGDNIVVSGEASTEKQEGKYLRRELKRSKFSKTILLGQNLDRDNIEAKYEDGLLTVTVPKLKKGLHDPVRIEIK